MKIYAIRRKNKPECCYIGQTIKNNVEVRWTAHISKLHGNYHVNSHLQNAWNKYGEDDFEFVVLAEAKNQKELNRLEWIYEKLFGYYNKKEGGRNGKHSDNTKAKMSNSHKGKQFSDEHKRNIKKASKKRWSSIEQRKYWSKLMRGKRASIKTRKKISEAHKGMKKPWVKGGKGSKNNFSKLVEREVLEIRELYATGNWSQKQLGERYEVCSNAIGLIVRGINWRHIGGPITRRNK